MFGNNSRMPLPIDRNEADVQSGSFGSSTGPLQRPPHDDTVRFGNAPGMQGSGMPSVGRGGGNFTNMTGENMPRMMNNRPELGTVRERMPNVSKPGTVRPLLDDTFFNQSSSPRPPQMPAPLMSEPGRQGNANSTSLPPPPPPPQDIKNRPPSLMSQTFGPAPVGVPAPPPSQDNKNPTPSLMSQTFGPAPVGPAPVGVPAPAAPSQGSVTDQQNAEQMQAAMAYYYAQWMQQQQQQQQQQPPPPPPPPPK